MEFILWLPLILQATAQEGGATPVERPTAPAAAPAPAEPMPAKPKKEKKKDAAKAVPQDEHPAQDEKPSTELLKKGGKKHQADEHPFSFKVGAELEYNDNVIRLDKRDIEAFNDGTKPDKFRITSVDDMIYTGSVEGTMGLRLFDHPADAGLGFMAHFFQVNTFMNYEDVVAFLKSKLYEVKFTWEPHVYRREHRDLDTGLYESAFYSDYDLELSAKLHPWSFLQVKPKFDVEFRKYDAPFEFYDTIYYAFSPRATAELYPWLYVFLEFEVVLADSFATDLQPDDSYLEWGIEPGVTVKPMKGLEFSARYHFAKREYTTSNDPFIDPNHAGRVDDRQHFKLKGQWKALQGVTINAEYAYTDVQTSKPFRPDITDDEWSWKRNLFTFGVTYQF